jgi:integrase/recombinase XerD
MLAKSITVKKLRHREMNCLGLYFPKDFAIIDYVKKIPEVKFSRTNSCWYVPEKSGALSNIIETLRGKVWVDISTLKAEASEQREGLVGACATEKTALRLRTEPKVDNTSLEEVRVFAWEQMRKRLKLKNYSLSTQKTYMEQFKLFLRFFPDSHPGDLDESEIKHYLLYLIEKKKLSVSTQNQAINAIKFFYEKVLKQERKVYDVERPMKEKKLPEVLSQEEVMAIFEATSNLKHKAMLMLLYASGLRRGELLNLRIGDADFNRNIVFIRGGKGRKDRQTVMAQSLVPLVEQYIDTHKPRFWLFEGLKGERYSATSLQQVLKRAVDKAGIRKRVRLHMLRHSFATHLLEAGTSTRYIQVLLGHESPKTTEIYAQVTRFGMDKVISPLDHIAATKQLRGDEE